MKNIFYLALAASLCGKMVHAQNKPNAFFTAEMATKLSKLPLKCINQEFPNKTSHSADSAVDAVLLPHQLHPVFYGCFDWHSSVHGHWMLVKLLKQFPNLSNKADIFRVLEKSFNIEKMQAEAAYFTKYTVSKNFERTYGWAWLLKLDEELATWDNPKAKEWRKAMEPLTTTIVKLWVDYLPKQTYPNRTGVHPNTAFAMVFAIDWARATKNESFESQLTEKAKVFYHENVSIPAYLEPDGSDFFSPSLEAADLMRRVMEPSEFVRWIDSYYEDRSIDRLAQMPEVSDRNDYQIVHLDGLSFSRAWCMIGIAKTLPEGHKLKHLFSKIGEQYIQQTLPTLFAGNYGGEHWLASFAVYALTQ